MRVTLTVLASDIRTTNFMRCEECAGTRAVQRAGFRLEHGGTHWIGGRHHYVKDELLIDEAFNHKLVHMYNGARVERGEQKLVDDGSPDSEVLTPEDFTWEFDLPSDMYRPDLR